MNDSSAQPLPPAPDVTDTPWDPTEKHEAVEYDADTDTYRTTFDRSGQSLSTSIVSTVAAVSESRPMDLPPLYAVVDTDALATVVEPHLRGPAEGDVHVSLQFDGFDVTISSYGVIEVGASNPDEAAEQ